MNHAEGDWVRVTIEGVVIKANDEMVWVQRPGRLSPIRNGYFLSEPGVTVERLPPPPEPLYVNASEITEPEVGDIVRDADDEASDRTWIKRRSDGEVREWFTCRRDGTYNVKRDELPKHLTLLVRGGKVWPS